MIFRSPLRGWLVFSITLAVIGANARPAIAAAAAAAAAATRPTAADIRGAIDRGKAYLYSVQKDGNWELLSPPPSKQTTGQTAMVLYALLASGENGNDPRLAPAIDYLKKNTTSGVYALGMRCQVWMMLGSKPDIRAAMSRDAQVLLTSIKRSGEAQGFYFYHPGPRNDEYDHSGSQYGVLGAWAAAQAGVAVPASYWQLVEDAWIKHQDGDGGWAYMYNRKLPDTPGMTAVGVATLSITQEYLHAMDGIPCKGNISSPSIDRGVKWLADHFEKVATNERYPRDYPYATIYAVERAGLASGLKYFGAVDWYQKGAAWLVKAQRPNGAWPEEESMPHFSTAMALLFLSRGSAPILMNKLNYASDSAKTAPNWNQRPRDLANAARWTGRQIEREVNWQIVNFDEPVEALHDAPILYLAGNQPIDLKPEQQQKIKTFIEQGGIVLGNADCAAPAFANSFKALGAKLFPIYEFAPLPDTHPIYTGQMFNRSKWRRKPVVLAQGNGAREFMILLPTADAGRTWQTQQGAAADKEELFQFAADLFLYAVDKQFMHARGETHVVTPDPQAKPSRPIKLARLGYQGNADPEPGGWRRLAAVMHNASQAELAVETVDVNSSKLDGIQVAHLTGTVPFTLTQPARDEIKRFVTAGGTLVVDAAGGSSGFARSAEAELAAIFGPDAVKQLDAPLPPSHALYSADGKPLGETGYRQFARAKLGAINVPQLRGITENGRLAVVYSREDLTVGLVGQPVDGIIGYDPPTATTLMSKVLLYAAGARSGATTATSRGGAEK